MESYELAFRMQTAAPELVDLSRETETTLRAYGVDRAEPDNRRHRGYTPNAHSAFGRSCLLARRLIERGVRFIDPEEGELACGYEGVGRLAKVESIVSEILGLLSS